MSRNFARDFQTTARTLIQFIGSPLDDIVTRNGTNGYRWRNSAEVICNAIEGADPRIIMADIQGAMAHRSSKDKDDPQDVITVVLQTKSGTRVGSVHLHVDGTWKFLPLVLEGRVDMLPISREPIFQGIFRPTAHPCSAEMRILGL